LAFSWGSPEQKHKQNAGNNGFDWHFHGSPKSGKVPGEFAIMPQTD
jgi:hypothetical protein